MIAHALVEHTPAARLQSGKGNTFGLNEMGTHYNYRKDKEGIISCSKVVSTYVLPSSDRFLTGGNQALRTVISLMPGSWHTTPTFKHEATQCVAAALFAPTSSNGHKISGAIPNDETVSCQKIKNLGPKNLILI